MPAIENPGTYERIRAEDLLFRAGQRPVVQDTVSLDPVTAGLQANDRCVRLTCGEAGGPPVRQLDNGEVSLRFAVTCVTACALARVPEKGWGFVDV